LPADIGFADGKLKCNKRKSAQNNYYQQQIAKELEKKIPNVINPA
jgi:hypothetical protein